MKRSPSTCAPQLAHSLPITTQPHVALQYLFHRCLEDFKAGTERLHRFIPSELHYRIKIIAFEGRTSMTVVVVGALDNFVAERRH